ncbi:MAG: pirin [Acetobacteraceae bacterium]|nr:pirin [Acetobacteraceae bacterium]
MGKVHQLILSRGLEAAKAATEDRLDRLCVDTAFAVLTDEEQRIGIMHAGFAMTALPHKHLNETVWIREGGNIRLRVESGADAEGNMVGIPFGSIARMILLYLQSEAVKTRSRDIELGRSMNQWLKTMGVDNGGKTYKLVREQSKRLSLCRLTFYRITSAATQVTNGSFVRDAILPSEQSADQLSLWREMVRLDEGFYQSLIEHPMPVQEAAIRQIGSRSMAIDVYIWLAYRLHRLEKPTPITWTALYQQFGAGFTLIRQFRARFRETLALALAAYPDAQVSEENTGLLLYPSPPPVGERRGSKCIAGRH